MSEVPKKKSPEKKINKSQKIYYVNKIMTKSISNKNIQNSRNIEKIYLGDINNTNNTNSIIETLTNYKTLITSNSNRGALTDRNSLFSKISYNNTNYNNNDTKSNMIANKKDNNSSSVKTKKLVQNSLQMNKSKLKKRNDNDIPFKFVFKAGKFLSESKILKHFLTFFNIRELFIIMELDTHIFQEVIDSEVFKKYLLIRNDFVNKKDD